MSVAGMIVNNGATYRVARGAIGVGECRLAHNYELYRRNTVATAKKMGAPDISGAPIKARGILRQGEEKGAVQYLSGMTLPQKNFQKVSVPAPCPKKG